MTTPEDRRREQALAAYHLLDAPPRRELLAVVELAARVSGVPMAAIDLITATERHRVATYGTLPGVCPREESLSATVVEANRPALVSDILHDHRFRAGPVAIEEQDTVRFFAAHPVVTPEQVVIGTLCVFDEQPHEVRPELELLLSTLAARVVDLLHLELTTRRLEAADERLRVFAAQVSHDLKNPLAAMRMSLELARDELAAETDVAQLLARAQRAAQRMDALISELLAVALGGATADGVADGVGGQGEQVREDPAT